MAPGYVTIGLFERPLLDYRSTIGLLEYYQSTIGVYYWTIRTGLNNLCASKGDRRPQVEAYNVWWYWQAAV